LKRSRARHGCETELRRSCFAAICVLKPRSNRPRPRVSHVSKTANWLLVAVDLILSARVKSLLHSLGAIVAGFALTIPFALGADAAMRAFFPSAFDASGGTRDTRMLLSMIAYSFAFGALGCFVAARLAPRRPLLHALVLGCIALLISLAATVSLWSTAPAWYHLASLGLVLPGAWLGGSLGARALVRA
jgi:hypothetical protein